MRVTQPSRSAPPETALVRTAFAALLALAACGIEAAPDRPKENDSGVTSSAGGNASGRGGNGQSGDTGAGGSTDSGTGSGGDPAGKGGSPGAGRGGSSGDAGTAGTAGSEAGSGGTEAGSGATSGTSGTGGSSGCTADSECPADKPLCSADGVCTACTDDSACTVRSDASRCALSGDRQGQCVRCLDNPDCPTATPHCNANTCVECGTHDHCQDPAKPQCTNNACTPCSDSAACTPRAATPHCVTTANIPGSGTCVACITHSDCTNPTPQCAADGTCTQCTDNTACTGRDNATTSDTSTDPTYGGKCVQCTGTDYGSCAQAGSPYVCASLTRTCTTNPPGSALTCKPCVADAHCLSGMACMQTKFGIADAGNHCLWKQSASGPGAPNADCGNVRPYVGTEAGWKSVDGETPTVCKPAITTCQAQNDFRSKPCTGETSEGHAQCGVDGIDDAFCAQCYTGFRCTVPCVSFDDCWNTRLADEDECTELNLGKLARVCLFQ
jgi:hypothetical protein